MAGPWRTIIKPALIALKAQYPDLREKYITPTGDVFCKCGIQIQINAKPLAMYRQVEIFTDDNGSHITPCCADCAPLLVTDPNRAFAYMLLDIVQWQDEADLVIDQAAQNQLSVFLLKVAARKVRKNV